MRVRAWLLGLFLIVHGASARANDTTHTILITHPRASVLHAYVTLVRQHVLNTHHLRIIGVYHASETESEDYADARAFLEHEHIHWIDLHSVKCALDANDVFKNNHCRKEFQELVDASDGIVLNGGPDIQPQLYGQPTLLTTQVETPRRHIFETALMVQLLGSSRAPEVVPLLRDRPDYPVLGICVGMQTMNVAAGGTLIQDIPSQIYKVSSVEASLASSPAYWHRNHSHELDPGHGVSVGVMHPIHVTAQAPAFLRATLGDGSYEPLVMSIHHQAVDHLGAGYVVWGTSDDGKIVEMMGRQDYPNVMAVQFHPERSPLWDKREEARLSPGDKTTNFAYTAIHRDRMSQAFNESVWQWLGHLVETQHRPHPHQR